MKTKITNSKRGNIFGSGDLFLNRENLTQVIKLWLKKLGYYSMFTALPAIMTSLGQEARAEEAKKPEVSGAGRTMALLERLNKTSNKSEFLQRQKKFFQPHQKGKFNIISELTGGDDCPGNPILGGTYTAAAPFTDSGDTTVANNTVTRLDIPYWATYHADGPDQIYTFSLTGFGPNPQIQVSATSVSYNPMIYVLDSRLTGCPGGTDHTVFDFYGPSYSLAPGGAATLQMNGLPLNVSLYLFVDSRFNNVNGSGPYTLRIQDATIAPATPPRRRFDFDGDGRADVSVFRPTNGAWYLNHSTRGFSETQFGLSTDKIAPADYDGDGRTDIAVYRDGTWYLARSAEGFLAVPFGLPGDIPQPADFTGDGRSELTVYRGGVWFALDLTNNQFSAIQFGLPTDKPVAADYDGDGRTDYAVYRNGTWYLLKSQQGFAAIQFGLPTDKLIPADYDGDGKTDLAVYREGIWYLQRSNQGFTAFQWGNSTDIPAPADYDGDGRADAAVFRDGVWWIRQSANGVVVQQFGSANDKPVPAAYAP